MSLGWRCTQARLEPHRPFASILIQSGFNLHLAAIKAVNDSAGVFTTRCELREWLRSVRVIALLIQADWPTPETKAAWLHFVQDVIPRDAAEASVSNGKRACRHLAE
jgi:hypothetical protein